MSTGWLDITDSEGARREVLRQGLTRLGGHGADIRVDGAGADQLHVWDSPARLIFVGAGPPPTRNGVPVEEAPLLPGDEFEWAGCSFAYGGESAPGVEAAIEEIPIPAPAPPPAAPTPVAPSPPPARPEPVAPVPPVEPGGRGWNRVRAGMLVDLKLADQKATRRWQEMVISGSFDPDGCAGEILARTPVSPADPRVEERAGRLLRDFLMAPYLRGLRGAGRRAREKVRGGCAFVVAQAIIFLIFAVMCLIALLVIRYTDHSVDDFLDFVLRRG